MCCLRLSAKLIHAFPSEQTQTMSEESSPKYAQSAVSGVQAGGKITTGDIIQIIIQIITQQVEEDKPVEIPWQNVCQLMLEEKQRLTSNALFHEDEEAKFKREQLFVPLALVERKKPDKREGEYAAVAGTKLYQPQYEEKQRFEHENFLQRILKQGEGKTQGRRIALIGEPGAGKSTLLQDIAFWVLEKNLGFPVWISLADWAQSETLTDLWTYLRDTWLARAIPASKQKVQEKVQENFMQQVEQGRVWLLLDGVDEVAASGVKTLQAISKSLTGWIGKVRVVLTCRLNVWEGNVNALSDFETYRLLDFEYPQQVHQFIDNWFAGDTAKGKRLKAELDQEERDRIRDLVQNPLRLALLCHTWNSEEGKLPQTQAGLYAQFVPQFYRWKCDRFPIDFNRQGQLNQALGCLAIKDIDSGSGRFRLRESFIHKQLGEDCTRALQLGWLNQVGVATESPDEKVYAFFHPTFEEYFAALAIDDWDFFLPREHDNKPVPGKRYRIFEPQWKQVILLWLGREDVDKKYKEQFINALIEFRDGCGEFSAMEEDSRGFYEYRAYFLAAAGIAECRDCTKAEEIVRQIVKWSCGDFFSPINEAAGKTLTETKRSKAIAALVKLLETSGDEFTLRQAAYILGKIDPGNKQAIAALVKWLETSQHESTLKQAAVSLGKIDPGNKHAIAALVKLLETSGDEFIRILAAMSLGEIDPGNKQAIAALVKLLETSQHEFTLMRAASSLGEIGSGNKQAIAALVNLLETSGDKYTRSKAASSLGKIDPGNKQAIAALVNLLETSRDKSTRWLAALSLGKILLDKQMVEVVWALKGCLSSLSNERFKDCYQVIWDCAQSLSYPEFYEAWHNPDGWISRIFRLLR